MIDDNDGPDVVFDSVLAVFVDVFELADI